MRDREVGGEASPSAAVIDSQSVKTAEAGGPRGYDAGKKIKGRKRHAWSIPTAGRYWFRRIRPTFRTATAHPLLKASRKSFPFIKLPSQTAPTMPSG